MIGGIILFIIIALISIYINYHFIRLIYFRYIKSYKTEIFDRINSFGFQLVDSYYPSEIDWENSPFKKPYESKFKTLLTFLTGFIYPWYSESYLKIIAEKNNKIQEFWIQIITSYFQRPIINIQKGKSLKSKRTENKFIIVDKKCPACGHNLNGTETSCPDCGLNFI